MLDVTIFTSFSCSSLPSILESVASDLELKIRYDDLFKQNSTTAVNTTSISILMVRLEDLIYYHPEQRAFNNLPDAEERRRTLKNEGSDTTELSPTLLEIPPSLQDWIEGEKLLTMLLKNSISPNSLVLICPSCPAAYDHNDKESLRIRNEAIYRIVKACPQMIILTDLQLRLLCQCEYYDAGRDLNEHAPFVPAFESLLAYVSLRFLHSLLLAKSPKKVIVLDCDNTLWGGVVGEDGAQNVKLSLPFTSLQSFFLRLKQKGLLLALSSKNSEDDVASVFSTRASEMVLTRNDIADSEIGWKRKSLGIMRIAERLSLDLSSFVFVDDSELECAEVKNALPSVAVLCLPPSPDDFAKFLHSHWVFDSPSSWYQNEGLFYSIDKESISPSLSLSSSSSSSSSSSTSSISNSSSVVSLLTEEDLRRTQLYKEQAERQAARPSHSSFASFLSDLGVKITISPLTREGIPRAAQLSVRTNQMNAAKCPFTVEELERKLTDERDNNVATSVWTVHAADRFGAYGVVGLLITSNSSSSSSLLVESFLLSCRVLQRGVEHCMLRHLGTIASQRGLQHVCIRWIPSDRNEPMRSFLFTGKLADFYIPDQLVNSTSTDETINKETSHFHREKKELVESKDFLSSLSIAIQQAQINLPPVNSAYRRDCRFGKRCERFGLDDDHSRRFQHDFFNEKEYELSDFIAYVNKSEASSSFEGDVAAAVIIRARLEREKRRIDRAFLGGRPSTITEKPKAGFIKIPTLEAISSTFNADAIDEESERAANLLRNTGDSNSIKADQSSAFLALACTTEALLTTPNYKFLLDCYMSTSAASHHKADAYVSDRVLTQNRMELRRKARAKMLPATSTS